MSLATPETQTKYPPYTANDVWDKAREFSTIVNGLPPSETVRWPVEGNRSKNSMQRSCKLLGRYYLTDEGIAIKRRYWYGRPYLSVVGRQAFESSVKSSWVQPLMTELHKKKDHDFERR